MDPGGGCNADAIDGSGCVSVTNISSHVVEEDEEDDRVPVVGVTNLIKTLSGTYFPFLIVLFPGILWRLQLAAQAFQHLWFPPPDVRCSPAHRRVSGRRCHHAASTPAHPESSWQQDDQLVASPQRSQHAHGHLGFEFHQRRCPQSECPGHQLQQLCGEQCGWQRCSHCAVRTPRPVLAAATARAASAIVAECLVTTCHGGRPTRCGGEIEV